MAGHQPSQKRVQILAAHLVTAPANGKLAAAVTAKKGASGFDETWEPRLTAKPGQTMGTLGVKHPDDVVVVSALRTAMAKANKGSFKDTAPEDMLVPVLAAVCERAGLDKKAVDDIVVGNCNPNGFAGAAPAKFLAGFPETVACSTLNRQCSSGLSAVLTIAAQIRAGVIDVGIGAGVERMSGSGFGQPLAKAKAAPKAEPNKPPSRPKINQKILDMPVARDTLIPMGITSENVSERYGIKREDQDRLGFESQRKAALAQKQGLFDSEIVPVTTQVLKEDGASETVTVDRDEGIRPTTMEALAKLKPAFKPDGSTTAGSSSQTTDGAAAVLLMRRSKAEELKVPVLACMRASALVGVPPDVMGIGPAFAIPEVLKKAGLEVKDVDVYEVNEAFASQAEYTVRKVGIPAERLNPVGGAIALGHPLGCTGARQVATLLPQLKRSGGKYGITSMCMGTGMGMAALFENEQ
uniref:acetyl-CoA C-acyltransferase n=1 Tax=Pyrodinium bahamense TaxID=73915 RepID=A0A7R9ZYI1_9DINO